MACKETKSPVRKERKYTAKKDRNENSILQQDKRAKIDETRKKATESAKQHQQRIKNVDGKTKKNIKAENTKQHQQRRKKLTETTR